MFSTSRASCISVGWSDTLARTGSRAAQALDAFCARIEREPLARIAERAVYADLAADGLSVFDRELSSLEPIRQQWRPIVDFLTA